MFIRCVSRRKKILEVFVKRKGGAQLSGNCSIPGWVAYGLGWY